MKKVVLASLLSMAFAAPLVFAQPQAAAPAGQVQMSEDEYKVYNDANTQPAGAAKAAAFQAYLTKYPNSSVKMDVLNQILYNLTQTQDKAGTEAAADTLLAADPNNLRALTVEVYYRRADADQIPDAAAKAAALDKVAAYAQTALAALNGPAPKGTDDATWATQKASTLPVLQSAIADDYMAKKDYAGEITALKAEIAADPADTQKPSQTLQDVYILAQAYYQQATPDYLNCAWYAARAAAFAPEPYKTTINQLGNYCYVKYHGKKDGYDALVTMAQGSIDPPADLATKVTPAPKPEDYVVQIISTTPDLATLALSDKEFIIQYGKPEDADKVFATIKGKSVEIPDAVVIAATDTQLTLAVSDDAVQGKTADFTVNMKTPFSATKPPVKMPAVGDKVTFQGVYDSYTQKPVMITMTDGELVVKAAKKPAAPVHHTPARRPTH